MIFTDIKNGQITPTKAPTIQVITTYRLDTYKTEY